MSLAIPRRRTKLEPRTAVPDDIAEMSTDDLMAELQNGFADVADRIRRLGWIVATLEERGCNLDDLHVPFLRWLRLIAHGSLLPEALTRFWEDQTRLGVIASLPLPDQQRVVAERRVALVIRRPNGEFDKRMMDPLDMTRVQFDQVLTTGKILSESEQIALLDRPQSFVPPAPILLPRSMPATVKHNPKTGEFRVKGKVTRVVLTDALVASRPAPPLADEPRDKSVSIALTATQHKMLAKGAAEAGVSVSVHARHQLIAFGVICGDAVDS